jgi:HNH endonuclease
MRERRATARQKAAISERAGGRCEYCRCPAAYSPDPFSVEHIHPWSAGGATHLSNLALSCLGCNNLKYNHIEARDPLTGEIVPLYNPRKDRWEEHFAWSEEIIEIVGCTPRGRATVERLQLNRPGVINLRRHRGRLCAPWRNPHRPPGGSPAPRSTPPTPTGETTRSQVNRDGTPDKQQTAPPSVGRAGPRRVYTLSGSLSTDQLIAARGLAAGDCFERALEQLKRV